MFFIWLSSSLILLGRLWASRLWAILASSIMPESLIPCATPCGLRFSIGFMNFAKASLKVASFSLPSRAFSSSLTSLARFGATWSRRGIFGPCSPLFSPLSSLFVSSPSFCSIKLCFSPRISCLSKSGLLVASFVAVSLVLVTRCETSFMRLSRSNSLISLSTTGWVMDVFIMLFCFYKNS